MLVPKELHQKSTHSLLNMSLNIYPFGQNIQHVIRTRRRVVLYTRVCLAVWQFDISGCVFRAKFNPSTWPKNHLLRMESSPHPSMNVYSGQARKLQERTATSMPLHFCYMTSMSKFDFWGCDVVQNSSFIVPAQVSASLCLFWHFIGDLPGIHEI